MERKSRILIYERKEVLLLLGLAVLVGVFVFTFGVHLGKRVPPRGVRNGEPAVPEVNQIADHKTTRHDIQDQVLQAQGAADVIADETLRDEVAKAGIRLDPYKQVNLPEKSVPEKKGEPKDSGVEPSQVSGLLAAALKRATPDDPYTLQIAAIAVTEGAHIEGSLKGLTIGTNLRWESGKIIGYRLKPATFSFGGLDNYAGQTYDVDAPFTSKAILTGGMQTSYRCKIYGGRIGWRVQFNAQNLFSETGLRKIGANSDGSPVWGIAPARAFELSNSFEF